MEFVLRGESEEDEEDVNIAQVDGNDDTDISEDDEVNESSDDEYKPTEAQRRNSNKVKKKNPAIVISSDEDYEPSEAVRVKTKTSRRNNQSQKPVFSDNRTVYYHEVIMPSYWSVTY